jgi:phospholipase C
MQENRSFDTYFGTYPGANGIPKNFCMPVSTQFQELGCIKPFHSFNNTPADLPHGHRDSIVAYDNGKMDGFLVAARFDNKTMSYYDNNTIPYYWNLAKHFVLADNFFSSSLSYSLPNHWYAIAAMAPKVLEWFSPYEGLNDAFKNQYLKESNLTKTITDLFMISGNSNNNSISWKWYQYPISLNGYQSAIKSNDVIDYFNPFVAKASSYTKDYVSHFVKRTDIFADIKNNSLPEVSWVIPKAAISEHPPAKISLGMAWVKSVVNAVMNSPYWNSTAIIITWDSYGGFFDHVRPPTIVGDNNNNSNSSLGFRVPAIIISPYAKSSSSSGEGGFIDHTQYSFESILKFIEWSFGLPPLNNRDAHANNLLNAFDFNQKPLSPYIVPNTEEESKELSSVLG